MRHKSLCYLQLDHPQRCPERAIDSHIYQGWNDPGSRLSFYQDACRQKNLIAKMERDFGPVIVGEWSLATDNCAVRVEMCGLCLGYVVSLTNQARCATPSDS